MDLETFIQAEHLKLINDIKIPYWYYNNNKLSKIYINDYFTIIKYNEVIRNILLNSNFIPVKFIYNQEDINDNVIMNPFKFYENIRIAPNNAFINLYSFFNTTNLIMNAHISVYNDKEFEDICDIVLDKIFCFMGVMNVFFFAKIFQEIKKILLLKDVVG